MSAQLQIEVWFPELSEITDAGLRAQVVATWESALALAGVPDPCQVPFALDAPGESLRDHIRSVTRAALALTEIAREGNGPPVDRNVILASCLLHDVDKLLMVEADGSGGFRQSASARRLGHGVLGGILCREQGLPEQIVHLVVTHTMRSPLPPEPFEGAVLHYADFFAADMALFEAGAPLLMHRR